MEIRKSPGRFISIFFIVMLGVAFFSGIRASEPSMRITGDAYYDSANLMDIKAFSTYGVTEDDVRAIAQVEGVAHAEGAYSADFLQEADGVQEVLHVMSLSENVNQPVVDEGRLPERVGECLADNQLGYQIGDKIQLESGTEDDVTDTLKTEELEVVGIGSTSAYISFNRGSTTIGTGSIDGFLVVTEDSFDLDVYTEMYVQVEGAKELVAYTDKYEGKVDEVLERIEVEAEKRGKVRKQEIVDEANEELDEAKQELADGKKEAEEELADARNQIEDAEKQLDAAKKQIADGRQQLKEAKATLNSKEKELKQAEKDYQSGLEQYELGLSAYENGLAEFEQQKPQAEAQIQEGRQQMAGLLGVIQLEKEFLAELQVKVENGTATEAEMAQAAELTVRIEQEEQLYSQTMAQLDAAQQELDNTEATLAATKTTLETTKTQLNTAKKQINSGKKQISDAWDEIEASEKKLSDGAAEILESEKQLEEAKEDYEEGKKEAEEEIADAEEKIADAEKEINELKNPKWYVYDRSTLPEYSGLGENAERIGAIGKVFPVIFFLVAAMISLTCMTRMVEEQRTIIGTLKALGYSKFEIASKYLGYALLATAGGSVLGVLVGEKVIPWIIIFAYSIIYPNLPEILTPYELKFSLMASAAAIVCTTAATLFACYKELQAQPAALMRPPAPKKGKRVLLERIEFIWKRLNFSWKSTVRNLFRYKKRFFMTIFGISGCMALLIVGFGLKDSIFEISALQYTDIQVYDGMVYQQEDLDKEEIEELETYLSDNPEVKRFMNVDMTSVTLKNGKNERQTYQMVFSEDNDVEEYVNFRDRESKVPYELSEHGVILSEKTAKLLNASVGDTIEIKDEENGNKEIVIEYICENYMGHYMYLSRAYYEEVYEEEAEYNCILFETDEEYEPEQIEEVGKDILLRDEVLSVTYMHDIQKQLDNMLSSLNLVIIVLIVSAGLLAFVVLYNLNTVNITERKRELATLKVLGFFNHEVAAYVYRENVLLTFIGAFFGVFFGKILHSFIIQTVEVDAAMFGRIVKPVSYLYSLLFTIAFSMIVNGVMYFKLKKIDMVESLKSIE